MRPFDAIHSTNAKAMLQDYRIGELAARGCLDGSNSTHGSGWGSSLLTRPDAPLPVHDASVSRPQALDPKQYVPCRLVAKTVVSRDVRLFRFSLPTEDHVLGLPAGKHILLSANINGKPCVRAYTPVSSDDEDAGFFRLLIKIYYKGIHPTFPAGGLMSQYLEDLPLGSESVRVKGPLGRIQYEGRGNFTVNGKQQGNTKPPPSTERNRPTVRKSLKNNTYACKVVLNSAHQISCVHRFVEHPQNLHTSHNPVFAWLRANTLSLEHVNISNFVSP